MPRSHQARWKLAVPLVRGSSALGPAGQFDLKRFAQVFDFSATTAAIEEDFSAVVAVNGVFVADARCGAGAPMLVMGGGPSNVDTMYDRQNIFPASGVSAFLREASHSVGAHHPARVPVPDGSQDAPEGGHNSEQPK